MILWLLVLCLFSLCEGASFNIQVEASNSSIVPCGSDAQQPCSSLNDAFASIPYFSSDYRDTVFITINSGTYTTCNASYYNTIGNSTVTSRNLNIFANGSVTLFCGVMTGTIISIDVGGLNMSVAGLTFSLGNRSTNGITFAFASSNYSLLTVTDCTFRATGNGFPFTYGI
jgi:hypothetical protein